MNGLNKKIFESKKNIKSSCNEKYSISNISNMIGKTYNGTKNKIDKSSFTLLEALYIFSNIENETFKKLEKNKFFKYFVEMFIDEENFS